MRICDLNSTAGRNTSSLLSLGKKFAPKKVQWMWNSLPEDITASALVAWSGGASSPKNHFIKDLLHYLKKIAWKN